MELQERFAALAEPNFYLVGVRGSLRLGEGSATPFRIEFLDTVGSCIPVCLVLLWPCPTILDDYRTGVHDVRSVYCE